MYSAEMRLAPQVSARANQGYIPAATSSPLMIRDSIPAAFVPAINRNDRSEYMIMLFFVYKKLKNSSFVLCENAKARKSR